jgi:AraC-like DNA-binding protein
LRHEIVPYGLRSTTPSTVAEMRTTGITERRMVEARRLLGETELTVEAIGARVGYRNPGYFARRFRRAHGASPLEWRRAGRSR